MAEPLLPGPLDPASPLAAAAGLLGGRCLAGPFFLAPIWSSPFLGGRGSWPPSRLPPGALDWPWGGLPTPAAPPGFSCPFWGGGRLVLGVPLLPYPTATEASGPQPSASSARATENGRRGGLVGPVRGPSLRASRVLLVGMKGLGAEVAKNLILAGVKALTMLDHQQVSPEDTQAQFLIPGGSLGKNRAEASLERAQDLNPMVDVKADPGNVEQKPEEFFTRFDVVCVTCCSQEVLVKIDQICHKNGVKFFAGDVFGYHGYMFANLGEHEFVEEKTKVAKASQGVEDGPDAKKAKLDFTETTLVKKCVNFCLLKEALTVDWSGEKAKAALKRTAPDYFLLQVLLRFRTLKGRDPSRQSCSEDAEVLLQMRADVLASLGVAADLLPDDFASSCCSEVAPVCAVVGGVLGQEVVKALSQRDAPLNNFFFFDGMRGNGMVECLTPN